MFESQIVEFDLSAQTFKKITMDGFDFDNKLKVYWIHCNLKEKEFFEAINQKLQLPNQILSLIQKKEALPKLIERDEFITLSIKAPIKIARYKNLNFTDVIFHLTENYCLTLSHESPELLFDFAEHYRSGVRYGKTPCFILFLLLDNLVNDYAQIIFDYELQEEELDIDIHKATGMYDKVIRIKQQVLKVKRAMLILHEILMRISGRQIAVVSPACRESLSNLSSHAHMIGHEIDSVRDVLNSLLSQIDNSLMQKMNETMRVLTAFAAIFLPLSLIAGIYGMNFKWIPELTWDYGYFYALGLMLVFGGLLLYMFKRFKWF